MGKPYDFPASFRPISLTACDSKLFERIILSCPLFFLESKSILSPLKAGFSHEILFLSQLFWMSLTYVGLAVEQSLLRSTSLRLSTLAFHSFFKNLFQMASLLALLVGLNLFFPTGVLVWFFKITKITPYESANVFCKDPFLALYFSLFINDLPAPLPSFISCSLYVDNVAIWSSPPMVPTAMEATQNSDSIGALVGVLLSSSQSEQM